MSHVDGCGITEALLDFQDKAYFGAYYVITPLYFLVGMSGNIALLIAFRKQSKTESAYAYQVMLTLSKTFEIFTFSVFTFTFKWHSGAEKGGTLWFQKLYAPMFFCAHIACPLFISFIVLSLLLSVAMTADRVFALGKPFRYRNIKHRRHQLAAVTVCFLIAFSTSAFEVKRFHIIIADKNGTEIGGTTYVVEYDEVYLATTTAMVLGQLRTGVRLVGVLILIALNIAMAVIFRKRSKKVGQLASTSNDKKEQERKAADKTLLILTIYQSCLMVFAQVPHTSYLILAASWPSFNRCYGIVVAPFVDSCIQVADAADFFVIIAVNRRMREAVFEVFSCCKRESNTAWVTTTNTQRDGGYRTGP